MRTRVTAARPPLDTREAPDKQWMSFVNANPIFRDCAYPSERVGSRTHAERRVKRFSGGAQYLENVVETATQEAHMKQTAVPRPADGKRPVRWSIPVGWAFVIVLMALLVLPGQMALAQDNATITGFVTDPSGALVPNANVTITNTANSQSRESVTNSSGSFRFANVGIGTYTMTIVAASFQKYTKSGIVVNVAQTVEADATLAVGSQAQTVSV